MTNTLIATEFSSAVLQQQKYEQELAGPSKFDPHEIRLSEAGQCARRQTLRALGSVATPPSLREMAIFETGHLAEERVTELWEAQFPGQTVREVEVQTEYGVGHIDLWIPPANHMVECKTTTEKRRKDLPLQSHVAQVTMYLHFWGNARNATAEITYIIKETGEMVSFPVTYDRQYARELIVGLMEVQAAIAMMHQPLPIPEGYQATSYPCAWYSPQGLRQCGFWEHCWGSQVTTEEEKKDRVAVVPALADDLTEYAKVRMQQSALEAQIKLIDERRDNFEAGFSTLLDAHQATLLRAGDVTVKRSIVAGRTITSLNDAIADGVIDPKVLAPYQHKTNPSARWTVRKPKTINKTRKGDA